MTSFKAKCVCRWNGVSVCRCTGKPNYSKGNLTVNPEKIWFHYGIFGMLIHYLTVFDISGFPFLDKNWEEKQTEKKLGEMGKGEDYMLLSNLPEGEEVELKELRKNYDEKGLV